MTLKGVGLAALCWCSVCPSLVGNNYRAIAEGKFQTSPSENDRPSVINSTYTISDSRFGKETYVLREKGETLTLYSEKSGALLSVEYAKVRYIPSPLPAPYPFCYIYGDSDVPIVILPLRSDAEARAVAEYVGRRAGLELIGGAWRVRKPFQCPEEAQIGCRGFKEMLDRDDPEIVGYFYERSISNLSTFACFDKDVERFLILQYGIPHHEFSLKVFQSGQDSSATQHYVYWRNTMGTVTGEIRDSFERGMQKLGWIDSSSLSFNDEFPNKLGGTAAYTLDIRWSTGRYAESYSLKDDKGKTVITNSSGVCVKLN